MASRTKRLKQLSSIYTNKIRSGWSERDAEIYMRRTQSGKFKRDITWSQVKTQNKRANKRRASFNEYTSANPKQNVLGHKSGMLRLKTEDGFQIPISSADYNRYSESPIKKSSQKNLELFAIPLTDNSRLLASQGVVNKYYDAMGFETFSTTPTTQTQMSKEFYNKYVRSSAPFKEVEPVELTPQTLQTATNPSHFGTVQATNIQREYSKIKLPEKQSGFTKFRGSLDTLSLSLSDKSDVSWSKALKNIKNPKKVDVFSPQNLFSTGSGLLTSRANPVIQLGSTALKTHVDKYSDTVVEGTKGLGYSFGSTALGIVNHPVKYGTGLAVGVGYTLAYPVIASAGLGWQLAGKKDAFYDVAVEPPKRVVGELIKNPLKGVAEIGITAGLFKGVGSLSRTAKGKITGERIVLTSNVKGTKAQSVAGELGLRTSDIKTSATWDKYIKLNWGKSTKRLVYSSSKGSVINVGDTQYINFPKFFNTKRSFLSTIKTDVTTSRIISHGSKGSKVLFKNEQSTLLNPKSNIVDASLTIDNKIFSRVAESRAESRVTSQAYSKDLFGGKSSVVDIKQLTVSRSLTRTGASQQTVIKTNKFEPTMEIKTLEPKFVFGKKSSIDIADLEIQSRDVLNTYSSKKGQPIGAKFTQKGNYVESPYITSKTTSIISSGKGGFNTNLPAMGKDTSVGVRQRARLFDLEYSNVAKFDTKSIEFNQESTTMTVGIFSTEGKGLSLPRLFKKGQFNQRTKLKGTYDVKVASFEPKTSINQNLNFNLDKLFSVKYNTSNLLSPMSFMGVDSKSSNKSQYNIKSKVKGLTKFDSAFDTQLKTSYDTGVRNMFGTRYGTRHITRYDNRFSTMFDTKAIQSIPVRLSPLSSPMTVTGGRPIKPFTPKIPPTSGFDFDLTLPKEGMTRKRTTKKGKRFSDLDLYTPTLSAQLFNIRGKAPKIITGLETRPLIM